MPPPQSGAAPEPPVLKLFVSHSSRDVEFVTQLVQLVRSALNLRAAEIRCTSVDGYRLPGGADTDEQVRLEVRDAEAFVGVISRASLESMYVAFELGARWGAGKHLLPVLAPGVDASMLGGPLAGINALSCGNRAQLHQLITDLATRLKIEPEQASTYQEQIDKILQLFKDSSGDASPRDAAGESHRDARGHLPVTDLELRILVALADGERATPYAVASVVGIAEQKAKFHLDELAHERELLLWFGSMYPKDPDEYMLSHEGRRVLVARGVYD